MLARTSSASPAALRAVARWTIAIMWLPILLLLAAATRLTRNRSRRGGSLPRLIWGPVPVIAIKYWSEALRRRGFESRTCVFGFYSINERSDFDVHYDDFLPNGPLFEALRPYAVFMWVLFTADVYLCYFDGGFLQMTALRWIELPLLRLAGVRIVASPYGSDIAVPGHLGVAEAPLLEDYPDIAIRGEQVRRRVDHFVRYADLIVRNYQYGYLPRWDVLWPTQIAIDTEHWQAAAPSGDNDGRNGEITVVHAPNHRHIKGTECLIEAVERLCEEGLLVRLELLERRPNEQVRAAILRADIVAEQFVAGYALFAIEGMAAARPVLSALGWMPADVHADLSERGLPIVDADRETLTDALRAMVEDPRRRRALGERGRRFVLEQHSYEAVGANWEAIVGAVWSRGKTPALTARRSDC